MCSFLVSRANRTRAFAAAIIIIGWIIPSVTAAQTGSPGKELLTNLITQAKAEGRLDVFYTGGEPGRVVPKLKNAFQKRFGLDKIDINLDTSGGAPQKFSQVRASLELGARPAYDALGGPDNSNVELIEAGLAMPIENWRELLAQINPLVGSGSVRPEQVSPAPFTGYSFVYTNRTKSLLYNTKLISKKDIPKSRADMANPRYKGKYAVEPWTTAWQFGPLFYAKEEWLKTVEKIGQAACCVLTFDAQLDRLLLGEFALSASNTYYIWEIKSKDPKAPVAQHWFTDYTAVSAVLYVVPKKAPHPAAGTLFALWMTTPEAESIWQPESFTPNLFFGQSEHDKMARESLKKSGSKLVSWYDNKETREMLKWYGTKEGRKYRGALVKALTQRK